MKAEEKDSTIPPAKAVKENKLESDIVYRFEYACEVIGLTEKDHAVLRKHHQLMKSKLSRIVDHVYKKMFQFDAMKRHFLSRHKGFEGALPGSLDQLGLDHEQIVFRKKRLEEYFSKLSTADWDETFAVLLDVVGHMHTVKQGNKVLEVPAVQIAALLGAISDLFIETIAKLGLPEKAELQLQRAYTKLFWVQNCMFIRHWTKG